MTPEEKQQILKELGGIPEDTYNELIRELIPTLKSQVESIKSLFAGSQLVELGEVAHTVKGSAGNFRLREVYEIAASVEKMGKSKMTQALTDEISRLEQAILKFEREFI